MMLPLAKLPDRDQAFVKQVSEDRDITSLLNEETLILSLLGTCGLESEWRDRYFVSTCDVQTVFGLGGSYVDGTLITMLVFTRESIARSEVDRFQLLFNEIKQSSVNFVLTGQIFET